MTISYSNNSNTTTTTTPTAADVRDQLHDLRALVPQLTDRGRLVLWLALRRVERRVVDLRRRVDQ